jgi:hypothetical protein
MTDNSETSPPLATKSGVAYSELTTAPFIYFDGVSCHGAMHGVIEIELVARTMAPTADGGVHMGIVPVGRLRCSVAAGAGLSILFRKQPRCQRSQNSNLRPRLPPR